MLFFVYTLLTALFVTAFSQGSTLDLSNPATIQFTGTFSSSDQYILLATAQSTRVGNFFQFTSNTAQFPYFIKIYDFDILPQNYTFSIASSTLTSNNNACTTSRNYIDCTTDSGAACNCFRTSSDPSTCISQISSQLTPQCNAATTYLDVGITVAQVVPSGLSLASPGTLTFHYLNLTSIPSTTWLVTISQAGYWSYPLSSPPFSAAISFLDNGTDSMDTWNAYSDGYRTVFKTQLLSHDFSSDLYCMYTLTHTGIVRGLYVNDYPVAAHSNPGPLNTTTTYESFLRVPLRAGEYNFITLIGLDIQTTDLQFRDCSTGWDGGLVIDVNFEYFAYGQDIFTAADQIVSQANIVCPDNCQQCIDADTCIECITGYLYHGTCVDECPSDAEYPDYKDVCTDEFQSLVLLTNSTINALGADIETIVDQPDALYLMILHAASNITIGSSPLVWGNDVYALVESMPMIVNITGGTQALEVIFESISDSSIPGSDQLNVVYYPIEVNRVDMNMYIWDNTSTEPTDVATQSTPTTISTTSTFAPNFLTNTSFYIFETVLVCTASCQLSVTSDGTVTLVKNDRTVLFDVDFITRWRYTYSKTLRGTVHLLFKVSKANYFKFTIQSNNYRTYKKGNALGGYLLSPLYTDINNCSLANCNNCIGSTCYSCNEGFYLATTGRSCNAQCSGYAFNYRPERACLASCGGTSFQDNGGNCLPNCNSAGLIYTTTSGCVSCVDGCSVCANTTTCKTCLYPNPLNTAVACVQKSGSLYTKANFTTNQTVTLSTDTSETIVIVVADVGRFVGQTIYFDNAQRQVPRIFGLYQPTSVANSQFQYTLPPISISQSGMITLHYLELSPDSNRSAPNYALSGFDNQSYRDFPIFKSLLAMESVVSPFQYQSLNGLFQSAQSYQTVIAQKVYAHDQSNTISCLARITYMGYIKGLYVNSRLVFFDSTLNFDQNNQKQTLTKTISLNANTYYLLTFTGYVFQVLNFDFEQCVDLQGNAITPNFSSYALSFANIKSDNFNVLNSTFCPANCLSCIDNTHCINCASGYYQQQGQCVSQCTGTYPLDSLFGLCDSTVRSQGFQLAIPSYDDVMNTIHISYTLYLDFVTRIIVVAFPFKISFGKFPGLAKSDDLSSLAEATYSIIDFTITTPNIALDLEIEPSASQGYLNVDFALYTIKEDSILVATFANSTPDTLDALNPTTYQYFGLDNSAFTLDKSSTYYYSFFLDCNGSCQLEFLAGGFVNIQADYNTFVFQAVLDPSFNSYRLQRKFTGLTFLEIYVWNSSSFSFQVIGDADLFSYGDYILSNTVNLTATDAACPSTCQNCYNGQCLSCSQDNILLQDTGSCGACPDGQRALLQERMCISSTCDSIGLLSNTNDTYCVEECPNAGFYYTIDTGCTNPCNNSCATCIGPTSMDCLTCTDPYVLNPDTKTCDCPVGTEMDLTGVCNSLSYINVLGDAISQSCTDYQLQADINRDEMQAYNIVFTWKLASSSVSTASFNAINDYLANQTSNIVFIPKELLQRSNQYNYTSSYTNVLGEVLEGYLVTRTIADYIPKITIDGGNNQSFTSSDKHQVVALVTYSQCLDLSQPLQGKWSIVSGEVFDISRLYNPQFPLKLYFPKCTLKPGTSTLIQFEAWVDKFMWLSQTQNLNISVLSEEFNIGITNGYREHPQNLDLTLSGYVIGETSCNSQVPITYSWSCYKVVVSTYAGDSAADAQESNEAEFAQDIEVQSTFAALAGDGSSSGSSASTDIDDLIKFVACSDPNGIFNKPSLNSGITVPTSYFSIGDVLHFNLTALKGVYSSSAATEVVIEDPSQLSLEIISDSGTKYSSNREYLFTGQVVSTLSSDTVLTYIWNVEPYVPYWFSSNKLKIPVNTQVFDSSVQYLKVILTVENDELYGSMFSLLPINKAPTGGSVIVFPSSGVSLSTYFSILTENWSDEDLPLTYQFSYYYQDQSDIKTFLTEPQYTPQTSTFLPGKSPAATIVLEVTASDAFGAMNMTQGQVIVQSDLVSLENSIDKAQDILNSLEDYDPFEKLKVITVLNNEINQWENQMSSGYTSAVCPACSGNGYCLNNITRCTCNEGWTLADCSLSSADYETMVNFKLDSIEELGNNTEMSSTDAGKQMIYNALQIISQNAIFNSNETLTAVQDVLDNTLNITSNTTTMSDDEVTAVSQILSSMLTYSAVYDCNGQTNFTSDLRNTTVTYLDKISQSLLANKFAGENTSVITTDNFDLLADKVQVCQLANKTFSAGNGAPQLTFTLTAAQQANCSYDVNLQYYAFSQGLMDCQDPTSGNQKTHIAIQFTDENGTEVDLGVSVEISNLESSDCPYGCTAQSDGTCYCASLSVFDVKSQILRIFTMSAMSTLFNITALLSFAFWEAGSFWGLLIFSLWLFVTLFLVNKKWAKLDAIEQFQKAPKKTKVTVLLVSLKATHPLLNVYYLCSDDISKSLRAFLYYARTVMILAFTSIFTGTGATDDTLFQVLDFNIYLLLIPYVTIVPIDSFTSFLLKSPPKKDLDQLSPGKRKLLSLKNRLGYTVMILVTLGCLLAIAIISANQDAADRLSWTFNFLQGFIQDLLLTPMFFLCIQYFYMRVIEHAFPEEKKNLIKTFLIRQIDPSLQLICDSYNPNMVQKIFPQETRTLSDISRLDTGAKLTTQKSLDTQVVSTPESLSSLISNSKVIEVHPVIKRIQNPIREESYEDSPCDKPTAITHRLPNFKTMGDTMPEEVFQPVINRRRQFRPARRSKYPSIHDDLETAAIDRAAEEHNTSIDSRPLDTEFRRLQLSDNESSKPSSWHNQTDSELLSTTGKMRDHSSVNTIKSTESPSNPLLKNSSPAVTPRPRLKESGSPLKSSSSSRVLMRSVGVEYRPQQPVGEPGERPRRLMYMKSRNTSGLNDSMQSSVRASRLMTVTSELIASKLEDKDKEKKDEFENSSLMSRRSRILKSNVMRRMQTESESEIECLDEVLKKENISNIINKDEVVEKVEKKNEVEQKVEGPIMMRRNMGRRPMKGFVEK